MGNLFSINGFVNNYQEDIDINKMPSIDSSEETKHSLLGKEYGYVVDVLNRNIGSNQHYGDVYGTPIGQPVVIEWYKSSPYAWFQYDTQKRHMSNYVDYVNQFYFGAEGGIDRMGFLSQKQKEWILTPIDVRDYNVGAIHSWHLRSNPNKSIAVDTSLGTTNAFYTELMLLNSRKNIVKSDFRISDNAYAQFGFNKGGRFSLGGESDASVINTRIEDDALLPEEDTKLQWGDLFSSADVLNSMILFNKSSDDTKLFIKQALQQELIDLEWESPIDYLTKITNNGKSYTYNFATIRKRDESGTINDTNVRYGFNKEIGNKNIDGHALLMHGEAEGGRRPFTDLTGSTEQSTYHDKYRAYTKNTTQQSDIIAFTTENFNNGKYDTLVGRFASDSGGDSHPTDIQSAVTKRWGMSHGRNLLKKRESRETHDNGYANPYCRVWTYHHQYARYQNLIRPFAYNNKELFNNESYKSFRTKKGLEDYMEVGVLDNQTGLPRITPTKFRQTGNDLRNLMFSIENLAWKSNFNDLDNYKGQRGPNNGRIMWFPPYGLRFNENVNVRWEPTQFIGRGESIYTYTNTERSGTLDFIILIDHPSIINKWQDYDGKMQDDGDAYDGNGKSNDAEQGLLRFFAGCDILGPLASDKKENKVSNTQQSLLTEDPQGTRQTIGDTITFNVFFPNNYSGVDDKPEQAISYLINGIGSQVVTRENNPYDPNVEKNEQMDGSIDLGYMGVGYEMSSNSGLTYFATSTSFASFTTKDFSTNKETYQQWLQKTVTEDGIAWNSLGMSQDTVISFQHYKQREGKNFNSWGYRCDAAYQNQILQCRNYVDIKSNQLNSIHYQNAYDAENLGFTQEQPANLYSLSDIFYVLDDRAQNWANFDKMINEENVQRLQSIIQTEGFQITNISVVGHASRHGYVSSNNTLANNRAKTIFNWLKGTQALDNKLNVSDVNFMGMEDFTSSDDLLNDVNSFPAKVWRSATVTIEYEIKSVDDAQTVVTNDAQDTVSTIDEKEEQELGKQSTSSDGKALYTYARRGEREDDLSLDELVVVGSYEMEDDTYGDEYKYFASLHNTEPFLHHRIIDKIKYFDPAFHSISPEGFNARLTFLHQCTRAGSTNSVSEADGSGLSHATNLAYGAAPVCVLKIGDFIHTKIIIDSISINYDDSSWDLNPEGIGVMPMLANVSISFKYIGSQSLSKPISRLGNALSFNYYANTEVYDNRSELYSQDI